MPWNPQTLLSSNFCCLALWFWSSSAVGSLVVLALAFFIFCCLGSLCWSILEIPKLILAMVLAEKAICCCRTDFVQNCVPCGRHLLSCSLDLNFAVLFWNPIFCLHFARAKLCWFPFSFFLLNINKDEWNVCSQFPTQFSSDTGAGLQFPKLSEIQKNLVCFFKTLLICWSTTPGLAAFSIRFVVSSARCLWSLCLCSSKFAANLLTWPALSNNRIHTLGCSRWFLLLGCCPVPEFRSCSFCVV